MTGSRVSSIEQFQESLPAVNEFWGGSAGTPASPDSAAHAELFHRMWRALTDGDVGTLAEISTADCVLHLASTSILDPEYRGRDAILQAYDQVRERTGGTLRLEPRHVFVDDRGHAIGVHRTVADRGGEHIDRTSALLVSIVGGRISGAEQFSEQTGA